MVAAHRVYIPLKATAIISMAPTNPAVHEVLNVLTELAELTLSGVVIRERKVYRDAIAEGRGVVEMDNRKAIAEIEAVELI